ncbi:MAG: HDOD domain-containing protein [Candidatus Sericytochromatia bacterium]
MHFSLEIDSLPTLPVIAGQVMQRLGDPDSSIQDIAELILKDQSMSVKILKLVNSAFYGFPKRIGTISHALSILGFETVRGLVLGISILDTFQVREFDLVRFWEHSIRTASLTSFLAMKANYPRRDEAFTVGLIHDVGKLVFMLKAPDQYHDVLERAAEIDLIRSETDILEMDHAFVGAQLAKAWNFPALYVQAIECHHQEPIRPVDLLGLRELIYLANYLDHQINENQQPVSEELLLKELDVQLPEILDYLVSIQEEVKDFLRIMSPAL